MLWRDRQGLETADQRSHQAIAFAPRLSPGDDRIAVEARGDIWI